MHIQTFTLYIAPQSIRFHFSSIHSHIPKLSPTFGYNYLNMAIGARTTTSELDPNHVRQDTYSTISGPLLSYILDRDTFLNGEKASNGFLLAKSVAFKAAGDDKSDDIDDESEEVREKLEKLINEGAPKIEGRSVSCSLHFIRVTCRNH